MMRFEKRRQREDETMEKFLDNLEMLRRRSQPDESNRRMNLAVASKIFEHTTLNQCANTKRVETQVKRISFTEAFIEICILQKQLW